MKIQPMTFSRQQLYELVWETPVTTLANTYLISGNGLRNLCKDMGIPLPDSGYWSKRKAGKAITRKPLTEPYTGEQEFTLPFRPADGSGIEIDAPPEVRLQRELEQDTSLDFMVPAQLTKPDPLVAAAAKVLTAKSTKAYDGWVSAGRGQLDISISPGLVNRALYFMDALIKLLKQRGFGVSVTEQASYLLVDDEKIDMTLREARRQETVTDGQWPRTVYHPTGKMTLKIERYYGGVTCNDGVLMLEEQLSKILARVEIMRERMRKERIEREIREAERIEKERKERELAERKRTEVNLVKKTLEDAHCWHEAQLFREYISHVKTHALATDTLTDEVKAWIEWASKKADWLDPLINNPDPLLQGHKPISLLPATPPPTNSNHSYGYSSAGSESSWPVLPWYSKK